MSLDLSNMSLDLSSISFYLSSMSFYLSNMSLDPSNMSFDLSSMSFVDDPLSQSLLWGGMKHFLSALKNLLVGNLKNFILFIHDCSQENFEENFDRDPKHNVGQASYRNRNTTWDRLQTGIETQRGTGWLWGTQGFKREPYRQREPTYTSCRRGFIQESRPNGEGV
ncbi:hypothetical protein TNCV_3067561 [Trichonephila clavipes]|nr:hypothetical protein TNCV_3067561 [Trichonephila clavipes]